jgi:hypothetical protein
MNISYPFGVGNRGCGHPSFQINCVQNLSSVITINGHIYTILAFYHNLFVIVRGQNCQFLNDSNNNQIQSSEFPGTVFTFKGTGKLTLYVYKSNKQDQLQASKCNASVYYALNKINYSTPGSSMGQVTANAAFIELVTKSESCKSCEAGHGICGYNTSDSTAASPFVCYCKDGPCTDKCPGHGMLYFKFLQNYLELLV